MKGFFLIGSIVFTVIILIVAFQNIGSSIDFTILFSQAGSANGTIVVFGIALLGIFAGGFYFGFLNSLLKGSQDEEEDTPGDV